jgi:hypothetical protein
LKFPVARRLREYAKPHWLPVVVRPCDKVRAERAKKPQRKSQ